MEYEIRFYYSKNKKNDNVSLNFPVFICVREDKDTESYES